MRLLKLDPNEIIVDERMRKEMGNIEELARSIEKLGQITPILVEEIEEGRYKLVAGERRLRACQKLGRQVEAKVVKKADELKEKALELVENVVRKDFTAYERAKAIKDLHDKLREGNPKWTATDTANTLGVSPTTVHDALKIIAAVRGNIIEEERAVKLTQSQLRQLSRTKRIAENVVQKELKKVSSTQCKIEIRVADFFEEGEKLPDGHFHAIFTDPPWGIDYTLLSNSRVTGKLTGTDYEDRLSEEMVNKQKRMFDLFYRLLSDDGRLLTFVSVDQFFIWKSFAESNGFQRIYNVPIVWIKGLGGSQPAPQYYPTNCYEMMLLAYKTKKGRIGREGRPNVFNVPKVPSAKLRHPAEKPIALFESLLETFAFPGRPFLDPFCGSGSSLRAAMNYGMSEIWGFDINPKCIQLTKELFYGELNLRKRN